MIQKPTELERKHLEDAISEILYKPFVLITAPSGYGKTTVVKSFFRKHSDIKGLWLPFGHGEVDEVWVWMKLCELFREDNPKLCKILTELGLPQTAQEADYLISVIREYVYEPVCIVFDDYHECNGQVMNRLIERIIYEEIPNLHLLIISRTYPDIACEELLLKGYCTAVDQHMLALSREESEQVFRINGVELSGQEAERMYEYTDGWIAAVYLVLYDYKRAGQFEHMTNIGRLMKAAIFDKIPDSIRELLMKMSLFESFTLKEACYVLGKDVSVLALAQVQEQFGFIQFDTGTGRYMIHALLKAVAGSELEKHNIDKNLLFRRCGEYNEKNGEFISAIICYKNAGAYECILDILTGEVRTLIYEQAPGIMEDIFNAIPLEMRLEYPIAYLNYIYFVMLKKDLKKGKRLYSEISGKYPETAGESKRYRHLRGELLVIGSILHFNDLEEINKCLREAYELLEDHVSEILGYSLLTFGAPSMSILYYRQSGELKQTIALQKEYARYYTALVRGITGDWSDFFEAEYALMKNDIETALALSGRVVEKAAFARGVCIVISSYYVRLRCLIQQGKEKEFYQVMAEFEQQMKGIVRPVLVTDYELACGYVYACIGRLDKVPEWLLKFELENCSRIVRNIRSGCVVYGMVLCCMKKWVQLDALADQIHVPYENTRHVYIIIYGYILKAIAAFNLNDTEKACKYCLKAVGLAEPDNLKIPFVEAGPYIFEVIGILSRTNPFCAELMPHIKQYQRGLKAFQKKKDKVLLTNRELELMQLVKEGMRNSEISQEMHIALVTVEKNLTSIYRKLNVSNRAAAIARMEELHRS